MHTPAEFLVAVSGLAFVNQQVTENIFGPWLHAHLMRLASIGVGVGMAFGLQEIDLMGMGALPLSQTLVMGGLSGLGSNVVHALWERFAPGNTNAPVAGILANLAGKGSN